MNDRYLFKAKRIDNGEWVRGGSLITFYDNGVKSYYMPQFNEKCVCEHDEITDDILSFSNCRFYKVDESTLCQCTGWRDKKKNLIWENDTVETGGVLHLCYWDDCNADYSLKNGDESFGLGCLAPHLLEVVGNIFDNSELMEVE